MVRLAAIRSVSLALRYLFVVTLLVLCGMARSGPLRVPAAAAQQPAAQGGGAAEDTEEGTGEAVIPSGQDELLAQMLGQGATLPGACKFAGGSVEHTIVRATYTCPQGEVVFELRHPGTAPSGATRTERFAITLQSGSPPNGLADALVTLVRARETAFEWKWLASPAQRLPLSVILALVAGGLLTIVAFRLAVSRQQPTETGL